MGTLTLWRGVVAKHRTTAASLRAATDGWAGRSAEARALFLQSLLAMVGVGRTGGQWVGSEPWPRSKTLPGQKVDSLIDVELGARSRFPVIGSRARSRGNRIAAHGCRCRLNQDAFHACVLHSGTKKLSFAEALARAKEPFLPDCSELSLRTCRAAVTELLPRIAF